MEGRIYAVHFAPDGKSVVFARSAMWCPFGPCTLSTTGASLYTVEFKGMDGFGTPQLLVQSDGSVRPLPTGGWVHQLGAGRSLSGG